jgi:serine O-acetyltransferase
MRRPPKQNSFGYYRMAVYADACRYPGRWWLAAGFWAMLAYRTRCLRKYGLLPWRALLPLDLFLGLIRRLSSDCVIPTAARIGPGFYLPHPGGVIFNPGTRIGPEVAIFQQVTLGAWNDGAPRVHAHACVFAGAKVLGAVKIGLRAFVGANAVVSKDVPAWYVAVGIPAASRPRTDVGALSPGAPDRPRRRRRRVQKASRVRAKVNTASEVLAEVS